jgi:hypothetical protein
MSMTHHQNPGQNHNVNIANRCFENVTQFKYSGTTITNQNPIHEEINSRLNSGNACYNSFKKLLFFHFMSKNIKILILFFQFKPHNICII